MEYITITLLAIAATTFLVYLLANKVFGVRLRLKSLALCAACALFLSLVLPRIVVSFAGLAGTVGLLAVFAIIFAYFVAYYDNPRDLTPAASATGPQPEPTVAAAPEPAAEAPAEPDLDLIAAPLIPQATAAANEPGDETPLIVLPAPAAPDEPAGEQPAPAVAAANESAATTEEPEPEPELEPEPEPVTPDPLATFAVAVEIEEGTDLQPPADEPAAGTQDDVLPKEALKLSIPPLPASDSLDDLIEFAFAHKDAGHYQQALDAFRRVLRLYRFSEAAPYAAIEIANLLKNRGAYDEAIAVLTESRNLLALVKNEALDQEFVVTIAYLRIVKNTLLQRRVGYVPFGRIPAEINREIDAEFREWRNLAAN